MKRSNTSRKIGLWKLSLTNPMSFVRPVVSEEASALGRYPSSAAAFCTFLRVFSETEAPSVKVRETAERETHARNATSLSVIAITTSTNLQRESGPYCNFVQPVARWAKPQFSVNPTPCSMRKTVSLPSVLQDG